MKKLRVLLLVLVLCLLTGCGSREKNVDDDEEESSSCRKFNKKQEEVVDDDDDDDDDDGKDDGKKSDGKVPSAEELINGMAGQFDGANEYINMDVTLNMDAEIDASSLGASGGKMTMKVAADLNMEMDKDTQHTSGDMHMEALGMVFDQKQDEYKEADGDMWQVYEYNSDSDEWSYSWEYKDDSDSDIAGGMTNFKADVFDNLKVEKDGDTYVVTGTISYDEMNGSMDLMDSMGGLGAEDALKDCYFDVTMVFDKDSHDLKSMEYSVKNLSAEGTEIKDFTIGLKIKQIGGNKEVTVPDNVISAAGASGGAAGGGIGYLETEEPLDIVSTGSYNAYSFKKTLTPILGLEDDDWYVYNNSDGYYTNISASMYDYEKGWSLYFDFSVYDTSNPEYFTAEAYYEDMGGEYYKEYLEKRFEQEGYKVEGAYKDDCALWYVTDGEYDTYYIAKDGNTILKVTGYVSSYSTDGATPEKFNDMIDTLESVVTSMGFPQ